MPNWCFNKLVVSGSKESMKEFNAVLKSGGDNEFRMEKFHPIPDELSNTVSPNRFHNRSQKEVLQRNGKTKMVDVDVFGRTEKEFKTHNSMLVKKYGFDNWYDWCMTNWGCKWDMIYPIEVYNNNAERYCVSYETPWDPNFEFVCYLLSLFPGLSFSLTYNDGSGCDYSSGTYEINADNIELIDEKIEVLSFSFDEKSNMKHFLLYGERNKCSKLFCEGVSIRNWILELKELGYTSDNVENWDKVIEYFNF